MSHLYLLLSYLVLTQGRNSDMTSRSNKVVPGHPIVVRIFFFYSHASCDLVIMISFATMAAWLWSTLFGLLSYCTVFPSSRPKDPMHELQGPFYLQ